MSYFIYVIIIVTLISCSSWKESLVSQGNQNDAIENAIIDFVHTCSLRKQDNIFSIEVYIDEENLLGLSVLGGDDMKVFPGPMDKIGTYSNTFPSRYIFKDNKLFYWYDPTYPITLEIVSILSKYNYIDSLNVEETLGLPFFINESKKAAHYYFCKNNLRNYKKVVTNRAMDWYPRPKLDCNKHIMNGK